MLKRKEVRAMEYLIILTVILTLIGFILDKRRKK